MMCSNKACKNEALVYIGSSIGIGTRLLGCRKCFRVHWEPRG